MATAAAATHRRAIVIDLVCPLANVESALVEWIRGGVPAIGPTVAADDSCAQAMQNIGVWYERLRRLSGRLVHVRRVTDIERAKREGKLGIIFHFQNTQPFDRSPELVEVYHR